MPQIVEKISEDSEVDIEVDNTLPTVVLQHKETPF